MPSLIHISDLHFNDVDEDMVEHLLATIVELNPSVVVHSGDITLRGTPEEFDRARSFLASIDQSVLCVPGNHDVPAYNLFERFFRPFRRYNKCVEGVASSDYQDDQVRMLGLNSARGWGWHWNWSHGRLSTSQIREANLWFASHGAVNWRGLVVHHPFEIPEDMPQFRPIGRGKRMLQRLATQRVHFILAGHLHRGSISVVENAHTGSQPWHIAVIQAPTATSARLRNEANAFNHIQFTGEELVVTTWLWKQRGYSPLETTRLQKTDSGLMKLQ